MSEQAATWQRVSVAEAADALGVSTATVRRMVRRGQLEGERIRRPQGIVYVVKLPADAAGCIREPSATRRLPPDTPRGSLSGDDRSQAMAAWAASLLAPIAAELGEARQTIERQAGELGDLRERLGWQSAELERATSTLAAQAEHYARLGRQARRLQVALAAAVLVVVGLVIAAGTLAAAGWAR